ncbi:MAG: family 78 glycoside hydrolase catalytic domain [Thermoguttaceae bacterium]
MRIPLLVISLLCLAQTVCAADGPIAARCLRCEYLVDPIGVDVQQPRLSWTVEAAARGQKQTAYQVLVATSRENLDAERGDLWDSGKMTSDETTSITYGGKTLASHARCCWKVKVWDKDGKPSDWSQAAFWSMGLLKPTDWSAEWIGYDKQRVVDQPDAPLEDAKWIWHAADPELKAPKGPRLLVSTLTLPENARIEKAELLVAGDDTYKFVINSVLVTGHEPGRGGFKVVWPVDVASRLRPGKNELRVEVLNHQAGPAGLIAKLTVTTSDGKTISHVTDGSWKSAAQPGAYWHNRAIDSSDWPACRVLGDFGMAPWGKSKLALLFVPPVSYLRTTFHADKPIRAATLYATALGNFDVNLNGKRISDDYFSPGWTDYTKRVYYRAYDVTNLVRQGDNALGAVLADGWYSGHIGWGRIRNHYGKQPRFRGQLLVEYTDGTTALVATGPTWKASTGPTREGDFLMGESYDARQELTGWDTPGYDASRWDTVVVGAEMNPVVQWHPGPAVQAYEEFKAQEITEPNPGVYVLNLGQNFAGVARLTVTGEPGQKITLRFAERLNPDGTIYVTNLRSARTIDTYICRGGGVEVWQPRFTFHGFQYVEISGLKQPPTKDTVVGVALSSATPVVGQFECSDAVVNRLHKNAYYTQRSNFIDLPTDCPQRDERLGWTGDAQVYVRTATLNTDVEAFFTKWLVDLEDGQRKDGQFPMVAPVKVAGDDGGPAWSDAGTICPWTIYEVYGDRRVLEEHYDGMVRFIEFCVHRSTPDLLPPKKYHCFGDWLSIKADTPKDVIYTAYFAYSARLTARTAEVLGKTEDAAKYNALFDKIKASFNRAYVAADGRIQGNTQACYVLALAFDLLDPERQKLAAQYLVEDIESRGGHLSTGFIGTKDLMLVLAKIGRNDVAYRLLHNDTFPSWGFSIKHGATSIWERWDGWTPENGFQDPGMNSFAHYSFGAVYQWMVENIGGIRNDGPAYKQIVIAPQPGGRLSWAKVGYRSIRGQIESNWKQDGDKLLLDVTIPANTTATVYVPTANAAAITESGKPLASADGVKLVRVDGDLAVLSVGSGVYHFAAPRQ